MPRCCKFSEASFTPSSSSSSRSVPEADGPLVALLAEAAEVRQPVGEPVSEREQAGGWPRVRLVEHGREVVQVARREQVGGGADQLHNFWDRRGILWDTWDF